MRLVPALARGLDVLGLLGDGRARSVPEITEALGLPRTTVHELVKTLVVTGYVESLGQQQTGYVQADHRLQYRLGVRVFELGASYEASLDLAQIGHREAEAVGARCQETVHVAVLDRTDIVYIAKVNSTHAVQMVSAVGRRLPAHVTAVGMAMLAHLPEETFNSWYPPGTSLPVLTPSSLDSSDLLRATCADVRENGFAFDHEGSTPGVCCVAAPIRGRSGAVSAAISISVPIQRWNQARAEELVGLVRSSADRISRRIGYRSDERDRALKDASTAAS